MSAEVRVKAKIPAKYAKFAVPIDSLIANPENARFHDQESYQLIANLLDEYEQNQPIVVREQNRMVAAGNGRLIAARDLLKWDTIAAFVKPMTDAQFLGYAIADNRSSEKSRWAYDQLERDLLFLREHGVDLEHDGWKTNELDALIQNNRYEGLPDGLVTAGAASPDPALTIVLQVNDRDQRDAVLDALRLWAAKEWPGVVTVP